MKAFLGWKPFGRDNRVFALAFRPNRCYIFNAMTYLAVPIAAESFVQAKRQIKAAKSAGAEMLELRTDYLENLSGPMVEKLVVEAKSSKPTLPIIVTCRDPKQGGSKAYPFQLRIKVLADALKAGAEFIDFEYENFYATENQEKLMLALAKSSKGRLILSAHNFEGKFDNVEKLCRRILTLYPAAIPKLVYTAKHINDCFEVFDLLRRTGGERIAFCMGEAGLITRIMAKKLGSFVTFASTDSKTATAPGQLTVKQFKEMYRYDSVNPDTKFYGVIGSPVAHSQSPAVHNACFAKEKMNKVYLPLLVEGGKGEFERFMHGVAARGWLGFRGFSVTIPHKQNALDYTREKQGFIEPLAEKIGAVNTLVVDQDGGVSAYNTDYSGALDAITSGLEINRADLKDFPVAVIGAGGVARAVVAGLNDVGAKITIYNRTVEKGQKLAAEFDCDFQPMEQLQNIDAELVINCSSIGMHPDTNASALPYEYLNKNMAVFDTVYNPANTLLLKQARKKRAKTISGLEMFVNQASSQFKLFTGRGANRKLMENIVSSCLTCK